MRLTVPLLAAGVVLLVGLPVRPATAAAGPVRVTAVLQDAHGHLTFRRGTAADVGSARALAGRWRHETSVVAADVDHRVHVSGSPDPLGPQQWGMATLRAGEVGNATGQVVAVVDTGVSAAHPDLAGVVLPGTDMVSRGGDGRSDPNGHGTHVAGIVAAVADNGIGGAGLARGAHILPVRVMDADGNGLDGDGAAGIVWAVDHGATVVNLSFGGPDRSSVLDKAVQYALGKNVAVVVSAGNDATATSDPVEWPAADPGVVAVGAVDSAGTRPSWSSTGAHLALVAPGVGILSTVPVTAGAPTGYATWSGTSMAAPFVSASVALLRHAQPALSVAAARQRLMATADDLGPVGFDNAYGAGRLDIAAAEGLPAATPIAPTVIPTPTTGFAPALSGRVSASRARVAYAGAVAVSARVLSDGLGQAGLPVRIERLVGTSWVVTRRGTSGDGGLASWVLHPDRTADYRAAGAGWTSPPVRVVVVPVVSATAQRTSSGVLMAGRVLPAGVRYVRMQRRLATGWLTVATTASASDGSFRMQRALAAGSVVRAYALGVTSPAVRV